MLLKLPKLPAAAIARIQAVRAWEDAGRNADFVLGDVRRADPAKRKGRLPRS